MLLARPSWQPRSHRGFWPPQFWKRGLLFDGRTGEVPLVRKLYLLLGDSSLFRGSPEELPRLHFGYLLWMAKKPYDSIPQRK